MVNRLAGRGGRVLPAIIMLCVILSSRRIEAQWTLQQSGTRESLRGLSVVDERVVWASGTRGTFLRTVDAGATWRVDTVPGATRLDFRDVHAMNADTALLLSSGAGVARIYRTTDGGKSWSLRYNNMAADVFLDGVAFWDAQNGVAYGDPIDGHFHLLVTSDGGESWKEIPGSALPKPQEGEAGFAASGTGIATWGKSHVWFGTGGGASTRVVHSHDRGMTWSSAEVPMRAGPGGPGIYSLVFVDSLRGVAVGGTYTEAAATTGNAAVTSDGGKSWTAVTGNPPGGYRSAVAAVPGTPAPTLIAVGTTGTDYSVDLGKSWFPLSTDNFNAVQFASAAAGWAVGGGGRIAKFSGTVPIVKRDPE